MLNLALITTLSRSNKSALKIAKKRGYGRANLAIVHWTSLKTPGLCNNLILWDDFHSDLSANNWRFQALQSKVIVYQTVLHLKF